MLLPCLLGAHWWWTHSSLWSMYVRTVSWPLSWPDTRGLIFFWRMLGGWPVQLPVSELLFPGRAWASLRTSVLCCAVTSSHRQVIRIPRNWLSQERWLLQIHLQSSYWISCPFEFIHTRAWMHGHSSSCAHVRKHVGTNTHNVCTSFNLHFSFITLIFLVFLASDLNGHLSSLLIDSWIPFMANE